MPEEEIPKDEAFQKEPESNSKFPNSQLKAEEIIIKFAETVILKTLTKRFFNIHKNNFTAIVCEGYATNYYTKDYKVKDIDIKIIPNLNYNCDLLLHNLKCFISHHITYEDYIRSIIQQSASSDEFVNPLLNELKEELGPIFGQQIKTIDISVQNKGIFYLLKISLQCFPYTGSEFTEPRMLPLVDMTLYISDNSIDTSSLTKLDTNLFVHQPRHLIEEKENLVKYNIFPHKHESWKEQLKQLKKFILI